MSTLRKSSSFLRGALALTLVLGCGAIAASAQTTAAASPTTPVILNASEPSYSSSADQVVTPPANTNLAMNVKPFDFLNAMQYGSGRRSGAPRYRGGNSNADGSNKWIAFGGGGLEVPAGDTGNYFEPSWGFQAGVGRQWSKKFALPIQFDYDHAGMSGITLANELSRSTPQWPTSTTLRTLRAPTATRTTRVLRRRRRWAAACMCGRSR